jgi:hypothetical protein
MEQDVEITAERVLHLVRSGMGPAMPVDVEVIQSTTATEILEAFRARFARACDAGVWRRFSNAVLEPANPFDVRARRRLKQETVILGSLVFTALGLAFYFNLHAPTR